MKNILILLLTSVSVAIAQDVKLSSEPAHTAVGAVDMRETRIITSAKPLANELDVCWKADAPDNKIKATKNLTNKNYLNEVVFENLEPNTEYKYIVNGITGSFKTKPDYLDRTPPPDFTFVALGNNYINDKKYDVPFKTEGGEYEVFQSVCSSKPDFAIWVGTQNVLRNADVGSESAIFNRLLQARTFEQSKKLFNSTANYSVPNADVIADSTSIGAVEKMTSFARLWANPKSTEKNSYCYSFSYADADFFVLDDFSNRTNLDYGDARPKMLGQSQMTWLFNALANSKATFKFIVMNTPIANPVESSENFTFASEERKALLAFLSEKKIEGVLMISGKKGYGEITKLIRAGAYPIYELTTTPLTDRPAKEIKEMNYFRVPSSATLKRGFSQIKIEGKEGARTATFTFFNSKGEQGFSITIKQSDLKKFE